ncbi:MAG: pyridoxal phosphate-dependent aminotransferase [Acidobacteria bacterium]|nr:pyridoxal phosphate-dependent aminotransferase [Acidobacteriota bacterium]
MISSRFPSDLSPNAVTRAIEARLASGRPLIDLTESNPTRVGLRYPIDLLAPLASAESLRYEPQSLGLPAAREAVAAEFTRQGVTLSPDRVTLTTSTSEAYALLFKLFCNPGDAVLVPQPSYPLFEHLTRLEAVETASYALEYHGTWRIDLDTVTRAITPRTKAVLVVSPNNPTGSYLHRDDLAALTRVCAEHRLALVGDEVFFDYALDAAPQATPVLAQADVLTCALGGLSKSGGLPQVKLGWIGWGGPERDVMAALRAYDIMADSYLSVSTPVQIAAPALLSSVHTIRQQIHARVRHNLDRLRVLCHGWPSLHVLPVEGGWSAVLRVPAVRSEESLVLDLLNDEGVLVHPGYFFDFPNEAFLVLSLLVEPSQFLDGAARVVARAGATA